jgi:hypothetical protein
MIKPPVGRCISCSKVRFLKTYTRNGEKYRMCVECCDAADMVFGLIAESTFPTQHIDPIIRSKIGRSRDRVPQLENVPDPKNWLELYCDEKKGQGRV